ncbi:hypothetical protein [Pleionea litopenaei]|uniref:NlpE-like protein n=1 Tax=Pleionea litopenaei TaxID=3070815 RepID=A0AA51X7Z9_9GAMM|nr:hypothetical protein [Pleionea sp. HL-JVS1]WMS88763.1 hypothetical protein Q9312_07550 [Pleionea sp. HL-JVS1]
MKRHLVLISLLLSSSILLASQERVYSEEKMVVSESNITLKADSGMYEYQFIGNIENGVDVTLGLDEFNVNEVWPASAYVGIMQNNDMNNSFQFLVIQNKPSEKFIIGGYRLVKDGEEIFRTSIFKKICLS